MFAQALRQYGIGILVFFVTIGAVIGMRMYNSSQLTGAILPGHQWCCDIATTACLPGPVSAANCRVGRRAVGLTYRTRDDCSFNACGKIGSCCEPATAAAPGVPARPATCGTPRTKAACEAIPNAKWFSGAVDSCNLAVATNCVLDELYCCNPETVPGTPNETLNVAAGARAIEFSIEIPPPGPIDINNRNNRIKITSGADHVFIRDQGVLVVEDANLTINFPGGVGGPLTVNQNHRMSIQINPADPTKIVVKALDPPAGVETRILAPGAFTIAAAGSKLKADNHRLTYTTENKCLHPSITDVTFGDAVRACSDPIGYCCIPDNPGTCSPRGNYTELACNAAGGKWFNNASEAACIAQGSTNCNIPLCCNPNPKGTPAQINLPVVGIDYDITVAYVAASDTFELQKAGDPTKIIVRNNGLLSADGTITLEDWRSNVITISPGKYFSIRTNAAKDKYIISDRLGRELSEGRMANAREKKFAITSDVANAKFSLSAGNLRLTQEAACGARPAHGTIAAAQAACGDPYCCHPAAEGTAGVLNLDGDEGVEVTKVGALIQLRAVAPAGSIQIRENGIVQVNGSNVRLSKIRLPLATDPQFTVNNGNQFSIKTDPADATKFIISNGSNAFSRNFTELIHFKSVPAVVPMTLSLSDIDRRITRQTACVAPAIERGTLGEARLACGAWGYCCERDNIGAPGAVTRTNQPLTFDRQINDTIVKGDGGAQVFRVRKDGVIAFTGGPFNMVEGGRTVTINQPTGELIVAHTAANKIKISLKDSPASLEINDDATVAFNRAAPGVTLTNPTGSITLKPRAQCTRGVWQNSPNIGAAIVACRGGGGPAPGAGFKCVYTHVKNTVTNAWILTPACTNQRVKNEDTGAFVEVVNFRPLPNNQNPQVGNILPGTLPGGYPNQNACNDQCPPILPPICCYPNAANPANRCIVPQHIQDNPCAACAGARTQQACNQINDQHGPPQFCDWQGTKCVADSKECGACCDSRVPGCVAVPSTNAACNGFENEPIVDDPTDPPIADELAACNAVGYTAAGNVACSGIPVRNPCGAGGFPVQGGMPVCQANCGFNPPAPPPPGGRQGGFGNIPPQGGGIGNFFGQQGGFNGRQGGFNGQQGGFNGRQGGFAPFGGDRSALSTGNTGGRNSVPRGSVRRSQNSVGRSRNSRGRSRTSEGRSRNSTGRSRTSEGRSRNSTGRSRTSEGRSRTSEGRSRTSEGRSRTSEGRSRTSVGRSRNSVGRSSARTSRLTSRRSSARTSRLTSRRSSARTSRLVSRRSVGRSDRRSFRSSRRRESERRNSDGRNSFGRSFARSDGRNSFGRSDARSGFRSDGRNSFGRSFDRDQSFARSFDASFGGSFGRSDGRNSFGRSFDRDQSFARSFDRDQSFGRSAVRSAFRDGSFGNSFDRNQSGARSGGFNRSAVRSGGRVFDFCGDNIQQPGEQCGEPGLKCPFGQACHPFTCRCQPPEGPNLCGDGNIDLGETCGEPGLSCGAGETCDELFCTCDKEGRRLTCGDGRIDPRDQCGEPGLFCPEGQSCNQDTCLCLGDGGLCGNGEVNLREECNEPGLACSPNELCEPRSCLCTPPPTDGRCGNGILDANEECDDGNNRDFDNCSFHCLLEVGECGDGVLQKLLNEQCEPSLHDQSLPYSCGANCRFISPLCGNALPDPGEECDEGVNNSMQPNVRCRPDCGLARCGDGVLDTTREECDDGNKLGFDGCSRFCTFESGNGLAGSVINLPFGQRGGLFGFGIFGSGSLFGDGRFGSGLIGSITGRPGQTPATGSGAIIVVAAGAAAGYAWVRIRRRKVGKKGKK